MRMVAKSAWALLLVLLIQLPAQAEPWSWDPGLRPAYIELCKTNRDPARTRDRICSNYIQASFDKDTLPEAALFFRERAIGLIDKYDRAAEFAYDWYHRLVLAALALAVTSAVIAWWRGIDGGRLILLSAIGGAWLTALSAFGYNTQFKAHFTAARKLTVVKDNVELALIEAARTRKAINAELIPVSVAKYEEIVAEHVAAFGGAFTPPATSMFPP